MTVIRDLTDNDFEEGKFLARRLSKLCFGRNTFAIECIDLAHNKILTRGQFETLRLMVKTQPQLGNAPPPRKIHQQPSKKPITLPNIEPWLRSGNDRGER